jgi:hypothetical protein
MEGFAAVLADIKSIEYRLAAEHSDEASSASYREIDTRMLRGSHEDSVRRTAYELILPCEHRNTVSGRNHCTDILVSRSNLAFGYPKVGRNWQKFYSLSQTTYRRYELMDTNEYKWTRHLKCSVEPFCGVYVSMEVGCSDLYNPLSVGARIEYRHVLAGGLISNWTSMEEIIAASDALKARRQAGFDDDSDDSD